MPARGELPFVLGWTDSAGAEIYFAVRAWNTGELGLRDHQIRALAQTKDGYIWMGTDRGLHRFDGLSARQILPERKHGTIRLSVTGLASTPDGALWIGTESSGIHRYSKGAFEHPAVLLKGGQAETNILQIVVDSRGRAAACSTTTVFIEQDRRFGEVELDPPVPARLTGIAFDTEDRLWMATEAGLYRLQDQRAILAGTTNQIVRALAAAPSKDVWYHATHGGLLYLGEFGPILRADLGSTPTRALSSREGLLWLTDAGSSLMCITTSNALVFAEPPLDPKQRITALASDADGGVWSATDQGLARISRRESQVFDGKLPVYIETLLVDGVSTELMASETDQSVTLGAGAKSLEIRFAAIHLRDPGAVRFRYQLVGLEPDWVEASSRKSAYYTHLPDGDYRFRVQAYLAGTAAGSFENSVRIRVEPHWWERRSVMAGALVGAVSLAASLHGVRVHRLTRQKRDQMAFSRRLMESQESERKRISQELHDSLAQSLLVIKNRAFFALQDQEQPEVLKSHLTEIYEASGEAVGEVREISHALHPPQLERVGLSRTIESVARQVAKAGNLQLTTHLDPIDELFDASESINLLRIVQESLANALKHSNASSITLTVRRRSQEVVVEVQDDGRGFPESREDGSDPEAGLGLLTLRERARTLGGELQILSKPQEGVTLVLTIPIRPKSQGGTTARRG